MVAEWALWIHGSSGFFLYCILLIGTCLMTEATPSLWVCQPTLIEGGIILVILRFQPLASALAPSGLLWSGTAGILPSQKANGGVERTPSIQLRRRCHPCWGGSAITGALRLGTVGICPYLSRKSSHSTPSITWIQ